MKFTWEKCPYCHKTINFKSEGGAGWVESPIGEPGFFLCKFCRHRISNGKHEWCDLDFVDRSVHILRMIYTVFLIGGILGLIVSAMVVVALGSGNEPVFSEKGVMIWAIWFLIIAFIAARDVWLDIKESNERVANKLKVSD